MTMARLFFPHNVDDGLQLRPTRFVDLDTGEELRFTSVEIGDGAVRQAYEVGSGGWMRLGIDFELKSSLEDLRSLLHPGEAVELALKPILSVRCPTTNLRFVAPVDRGKAGWRSEVVIDRLSVRRVVTIKPILLRSAPGVSHPIVGRANVSGSLIGEGPAVQLIVDASANPFEGGLDVRWEDFRASADLWRRTHDTDIYSISFEPEPILWLNSRHQELRAILHNGEDSGATSFVRQALFSYLKEGVWASLFRAAASSIARDPETDKIVIPDGWQEVVVDNLLPHLYPEAGGQDERLDELASALLNPDAGTDVEVRLRSAVQALADSTKSMTRMLRVTEES